MGNKKGLPPKRDGPFALKYSEIVRMERIEAVLRAYPSRPMISSTHFSSPSDEVQIIRS